MRIIRVLKSLCAHPQNDGAAILTILKFFRWYVSSRLLSVDYVIPWVENTKFIQRKGRAGITGNFYCGLHDFSEMSFLLHVISEDHHFFDVGANVGAYTLLASSVVGAKSVAFEPVSDTAKSLQDNVSLNSLGSLVTVRHMGVGATPKVLHFSTNNDATNKVTVAENPLSEEVSITTLDHEFERLEEVEALIIKIDVEGYEGFVLRGAEGVLADGKLEAVIIELNQSGREFGFDDSELHNILITAGFHAVSYEGFSRTLRCLDSWNQQSKNTIYVRDIEDLQERVRNAPRRTVHTANGLNII